MANSNKNRKVDMVSEKVSIKEWGGIVLFIVVYAIIERYCLSGAVKENASTIISFIALGAVGAYRLKFTRYSAKVWIGMIIQETDSGRDPHFEYFIRRCRPSFWLSPLSHIFKPWLITVGKISGTGSVSVTLKQVKHVLLYDKIRWECGTNEVISGKAAQHLRLLHAELDCKGSLDEKEKDRLATINAALKAGVKIEGL